MQRVKTKKEVFCFVPLFLCASVPLSLYHSAKIKLSLRLKARIPVSFPKLDNELFETKEMV